MKKIIANKNDLPECWLMENQQISYYSPERKRKLPRTNISFEDILKKLNIPYRVVGNHACEYWDPKFYIEEEVTLPLYIKCDTTGYRFACREYTDKTISLETYKRAQKIQGTVWRAIKAFSTKKHKEELWKMLKWKLDGKVAAAMYYNSFIESDIIFNNDHFKVVRVDDIRRDMNQNIFRYSTDYYMIMDVNKIEMNSEIVLEVPKGKKGVFIGKGGWQVKEWLQRFDLKKIYIVESA